MVKLRKGMKKHEEKDFKHRTGTMHGADHDADGYRRGMGGGAV